MVASDGDARSVAMTRPLTLADAAICIMSSLGHKRDIDKTRSWLTAN
jgi:hypothetical protein